MPKRGLFSIFERSSMYKKIQLTLYKLNMFSHLRQALASLMETQVFIFMADDTTKN